MHTPAQPNTTSAHTPGPWHPTQKGYVNAPWDVQTESGQMIAGVFGKTGTQQEANARLIAAAPDLLAALEDVLNCDGDLDSMDFDYYRAAIAHATGKGGAE